MTFQWKFKYKLRFVKLVFLVEFSNFTFVTHWAVTTTQSQIFKWKWMPLQFFLQGFSVWHSIWQEASSLCLPLKGLGVGWKQEKGGAWEGRTEWASERMKEDLFQSLGGISLTTQSKKEKKKFLPCSEKLSTASHSVSALGFKSRLLWKPRTVHYHLYPLNRHQYFIKNIVIRPNITTSWQWLVKTSNDWGWTPSITHKIKDTMEKMW